MCPRLPKQSASTLRIPVSHLVHGNVASCSYPCAPPPAHMHFTSDLHGDIEQRHRHTQPPTSHPISSLLSMLDANPQMWERTQAPADHKPRPFSAATCIHPQHVGPLSLFTCHHPPPQFRPKSYQFNICTLHVPNPFQAHELNSSRRFMHTNPKIHLLHPKAASKAITPYCAHMNIVFEWP